MGIDFERARRDFACRSCRSLHPLDRGVAQSSTVDDKPRDRRNGGPGGYRASRADQAAWDRVRRPKLCKLVQNRALAHLIANKLCLEWSPEQIAGWLKRSYPDDATYQVSHETIYRSLFIQARGALKKELLALL